jgi:hypothetical protein
LHLGLPSGLFPSGFPIKTLSAPLLSSPIHATCPTHLIILELINWIIFGEEYRSLSSSLDSFLHSPDTLFLLGPNIQHSILTHPQPMFLPHCEWPSFTPIQNNTKNSALNDGSIPWLQSALNFFLSRVLIHQGCSQMFEVFHPFKGTIINHHIVTLKPFLIGNMSDKHLPTQTLVQVSLRHIFINLTSVMGYQTE